MSSCLNCGEGAKFIEILDDITSVYDRVSSFRIESCLLCGLAQTFPRPSLIELDKIYSSVYKYDIHISLSLEKYIRAQKLFKSIFHDGLGKSVFEIGCGSGELLSVLQKNGFVVKGLEPDSQSVSQANLQFESNVVSQGSFENFDKAKLREHSLIIMSHVLEHFVDPKTYLTQIYNSTSDNAKMLIIVPNFEKIPKGFLSKYWGYLQVPVHVSHFTYSSLENLLRDVGYKIESANYRNSDFMSLGLYLMNIFKIESKSITLNLFKKRLIIFFSVLWTSFYRFGKQDLIVIAGKLRA